MGGRSENISEVVEILRDMGYKVEEPLSLFL